MNQTKQIIISLIIGFWLIVIALFSIQNIELISLKFFFFESIKIPLGVLLSFILAFGFIIGAIIPLFFSNNKSKKNKPKFNQSKRQNQKFNRELEEEKDPLFDWD
ncbi:lipopolysaccharide assembly protein LapA domain-containing protein [Geminocystis sp.]|uniref:lipopolysaccharide assembly protein LapA domain-containing protein n=1 Tax=Geminocystis sp. TaxID=2664100 RepID=UPI003593A6F3